MGMLRKSFSTREGGSSQPSYQPRIDTMLPSEKKKNARRAIGKAWAKWMHIEAVAGHKADSPYFSATIKETQRWGKHLYIVVQSLKVTSLRDYNIVVLASEGVQSPTGREINGVYLDATEAYIKKQFAKFKLEWPNYGVTLMCDSWTGPTNMSLINFMIYSNGVMFFHKSVDATGKSQDADFIFKEMVNVLKELGLQHVVQIITDNGANYRLSNPIRDWMEHGRSNAPPLLDEDATDKQLEGINLRESIVSWSEDTVGDTHIGKRKHQTTLTKKKGKRQKKVDATVVSSDASTDEDGNKSPPSKGDDGGNTTGAVHTLQPPPSPIRFTVFLFLIFPPISHFVANPHPPSTVHSGFAPYRARAHQSAPPRGPPLLLSVAGAHVLAARTSSSTFVELASAQRQLEADLARAARLTDTAEAELRAALERRSQEAAIAMELSTKAPRT
ncbi:hypothetical protein EJB05_34802, partial [Eragrostis curvula]